MAKKLFTIGYEQTPSSAVLDELQRAEVKLLVDVRAVAASRRPGFSKTQLAAGLDERGIAYLHLRGLGTPKEGREAARSGKTSAMLKIFNQHLKTEQSRNEMDELAYLVAQRRAGLPAVLRARPRAMPSQPCCRNHLRAHRNQGRAFASVNRTNINSSLKEQTMSDSKTPAPLAIEAASAPLRTKLSNYPEPFFSRMLKREKRPLGDLFGLKNFGVNLTTLKPGGESALLHVHSKQDELVYILEGEPTLVTDQGRSRSASRPVRGVPGRRHRPSARQPHGTRCCLSRKSAIARRVMKAHIRTTTSRPCSSTANGSSRTRTGRLIESYSAACANARRLSIAEASMERMTDAAAKIAAVAIISHSTASRPLVS